MNPYTDTHHSRDLTGAINKLDKILLNGNNVCMVSVFS